MCDPPLVNVRFHYRLENEADQGQPLDIGLHGEANVGQQEYEIDNEHDEGFKEQDVISSGGEDEIDNEDLDDPDGSEKSDEEYQEAREQILRYNELCRGERYVAEMEASEKVVPNVDDGHITVDRLDIGDGYDVGEEHGDEDIEDGHAGPIHEPIHHEVQNANPAANGFEGTGRRTRGDEIYYDSEGDVSIHSDDEADEADIGRRREEVTTFEYNPTVPFVGFFLKQQFLHKQHFIEAVHRYVVQFRREVKFKKNDKKRVCVKCKETDCPWRIWCSWDREVGKFVVKSFVDEHDCPELETVTRLTSKVIGQHLKDVLIECPLIKSTSMKALIWKQLNLKVSLVQCRKAKAILHREMSQQYLEEFKDLNRYVAEIKRSNPGSTVELQNFIPNPGDQPHFKRIYICFDACKKGFTSGGCRKVIGLDGCFLKGLIKGEILAAIGRDGNNQIYPIAWAVVEGESLSSWNWFVNLLRTDLGLGDGQGWVVISDQQKGLVHAVHDYLSQVEHRMCVRHLYANWRKHFKGKELRRQYWAAAKSSSECEMWGI